MEDFAKLGFSEEQADLLEAATRFCRDKSPMETVRTLLESETGYDEAVWSEMAELGWLGIAIPEAYGGVGLSLAEVAPICEQMGRRLMTGPFVPTTLAAQLILKAGGEVQKSEWLPKLASGTKAALALTEQQSGWDLTRIESSAEERDGALVLSGGKILAESADAADLIIVSALKDGAPALALVTKDEIPSDAFRRETIIDETRRASSLDLTGIEIPADRLLDQTQTQAALEHLHLAANLLASADMVGGTQAVIDYTLDYLKTRKQFGKLIGSYQALKHPIVDAYTLYEQARSHMYAAAHAFSDQGSGEVAVRMAKAAADKAYAFAADRSIQFHGGFGFTYDCDAQLYRRRALWHASQWGDAAYHKRKLANRLLANA